MSKAPEMYVPEAFALILIRSIPRDGGSLLPLGKVFSRFGCFPLREAHQTWVVVCLAGVQIQSDVFFVFEMFGGVPFGELRGGHVRRFGGRCIGVRVLRAGLGCS